MRFIKTYYTEEAFNQAREECPYLAYIIETGELKYCNTQHFSLDFNDDFDIIDYNDFMQYFKMYQ